MSFAQAYSLHRELGMTADGQLLPIEALTAIHWTHRIGAAAVSLVAGALALTLLRTGQRRWQIWGGTVLALLLIQISLGIANVLLSLPLSLAVAHTIGAASLLTVVLSINVQMFSISRLKSGATILGCEASRHHEYCR